MKKKIILCLIFILSLSSFIGYKLVILNKYKVEHVELDTDKIFNETISVKLDNEGNYKTIDKDGISIKDIFDGYELKEGTEFYVKYIGDEGVSFYLLTRTDQYVPLISPSAFQLDGKEDSKFTEDDVKHFLKTNSIKNDVDLLNYIKNNYNKKNTLFTCLSTIKDRYIASSFVSATLPTLESISLITGDLEGFILNINENIKEIHILKEDMAYILTLSKDIFDEVPVESLLATIKFYED